MRVACEMGHLESVALLVLEYRVDINEALHDAAPFVTAIL